MSRATASAELEPLFREVLGGSFPLRLEFWDGSRLGPAESEAVVHIRRSDALRRILYAPNELGIARAYVVGDIDIEGDFGAALEVLWNAHPGEFKLPPKLLLQTIARAARIGLLGKPLPPPAEESRLRGGRHSKARDRQAVTHHYDVSNSFYRLVLGPSMTYSCARFTTPGETLEDAQRSKFDLVCRKLGLRPGMKLLDVGCGWASMVIHAVVNYGVDAVGVTLSTAQADLARKRVAEAGLGASIEIRVQDYRDLGRERFQAISSIGMFEHVGHAHREEYFDTLARALEPHGRLLNHAITTPNGARFDRHSFINRYVFPDGELQDIGATIEAMQRSGLEARDVECLREHYPLTLERWVDNLLANWDEAVAEVGTARARIWRLYMTGAIKSFRANEISLHHLLGVKPGPDGASAMPMTRAGMV